MPKHTPKLPYLLAGALVLLSCSDITNPALEKFPEYAGKPAVVFSEIYIANVDYKDEYGDKPAWVELYNSADTTVNLKGYSLTNDASKALWTFGDAAVPAHSYLTLFLSGRNKADLRAPSDSIDLLNNEAIGAWKWADISNTPKGHSTAECGLSIRTNDCEFLSAPGISGRLYTRDNQPSLNWASATIMLKLKGWDTANVVDMSSSTEVLFRGYLSKNSKLEVRFAQPGMDDWATWPAIIRGTGEADALYTIELPDAQTKFPDLEHIYGLRFANVANEYGTIDFNFHSIVARKKGGDLHVSFKPSSAGGKLFLMNQRLQVRDSVAYPAETKELSYAKDMSNDKWALSAPTPNTANTGNFYTEQASIPANTQLPPSGYYEHELTFTMPEGTNGGTLHCDTTGRLPAWESALAPGSTITITKTTILRCAQFKTDAYPSEPIMRTYIVGERLPNLPIVSIAVEPTDMFDHNVGLYATGANASAQQPYYGANYWADTELPIHLDFFEPQAKHAWSYPAGLKIFGNWSRMWPKKSVAIGFKAKYGTKKLHYALFPEFPNLNSFNWIVLRNGGNNYGRDYIRDLLMTSLTEGLGIDYQKGRPVIVYYNGIYYGIHNLRERANKDYFETNYGIDESHLDLVKATNAVSSGSDASYQEMINQVRNADMGLDENFRIISESIDLDNYTNYVQSEIYFVNKDWPGNNAKRWRSSQTNSKWKWLLYDTDFGFGSLNDNPSEKMLYFATAPNSAGVANPPNSTLLLRKLLENTEYRHSFINRFSLLLATYFSPERVSERINALMAQVQDEIPLDQRRWNMSASQMNSQLNIIKTFGKTRASEMQGELEEFFGIKNPVNFVISVSGNGKVLINGLPLPGETASFSTYTSVPLKLKAVPTGSGGAFLTWSDSVTTAERTVNVREAMSLQAQFK